MSKALPKQLRNQIKKGKEIEDALRKEQEEAGTTDTSQEQIDTLLKEVSPDEAPAAEDSTETIVEETPAATVTELHPAPEGGDPASTPEPKPERTDWKQKYSVLKGKYDAEVPRLSQDLREANSRIGNLEDKLTELAAAPIAQPEPEPQVRTDFSAEEIADYGEDLLEVIGRKARQIVETEYRPKISELEGQVSTLTAQVGSTDQRVQKQETNEVFAQLDREVENWRDTNVDPEFHEWLDQVDPYTGETRKNLMIAAFNRKNAQQVKAFFMNYKQENAAVVPEAAAPQPSGQGGTEAGATLNLNDYVAPGTPRAGGDASAPRDKRMWTAKEVGTFYSDVQKGRYKNRPDDKARIEADIVAASREGRIQG